jgi:hypothetical protein
MKECPMQEVQARLKFNNYCLGNRRDQRISRMLRDPSNKVMFLASWWKSIMVYSAKVLNRYHELAKKIDWDPVVEGRSKLYKRYYKPRTYTVHEAFFPGDVIAVNAVLPPGLTLEDFQRLLTVAGTYRGISPYGHDERYGTFEVISVNPRRRVPVAPVVGVEVDVAH